LQADTQTTVTIVCLAGAHVLDSKQEKRNKTRCQNKKKLKSVKT